jgi:hypothetical protein
MKKLIVTFVPLARTAVNLTQIFYFFAKALRLCTLLRIYVNDLLIFGSSNARVAKIEAQLGTKHKMKDLGFVNRYLGIDFIQTSNSN